jgi:hypothetical protein
VKRPFLLAVFAVAILWICQFLTVHFNYGGNWTGLFCIAPTMPVPDFLRSERLYTFTGTNGYDGQMFHLIAHDPWMRRGSADAIAGAPFRYQRIFVPALAWMLAGGRDNFVHAAYFTVILGFAGTGVFWMARLALIRGLHPAWGLAFLAAPATITSLDRMTVDVALAAFCVGFAIYAQARSPWPVMLILTCATLTRETAALIVIGYGIFLLSRRQIGKAVAAACTLLPTLAWFLYVTHGSARTQAVTYLNGIPFSGFMDRIVHPQVYPLPPAKAAISIGFDFVALAGIALLFIFVARMAIKKRWNPTVAAVYVLALAAVFLRSRDVWEDAYNFGRVLSPLLVLAFIEQFARRPILALAPMLMTDLRIGINLAGELEGVVRGLLK